MLPAGSPPGESNMEIVPSLLDSFDFTEVFYKNQDMAEQFFTHIITGDYSGNMLLLLVPRLYFDNP